MSTAEKLALLPFLLPALIVSATLHELAHAVVARRLGDDTAERAGRITLNPIKHLDPFGSLMFAVTFLLSPFIFGWARPVPVYPANFRNPKVGMAIVAIAGPITNIILAALVIAWLVHFGPYTGYVYALLGYTAGLNIVLAVFNMLPIPPLDGSRVLGAFLPDELHEGWRKLDAYGGLIILLIFFFALHELTLIVSPVIAWVSSVLVMLVGG